jgi:hypothetical protein
VDAAGAGVGRMGLRLLRQRAVVHAAAAIARGSALLAGGAMAMGQVALDTPWRQTRDKRKRTQHTNAAHTIGRAGK